MENEPVLQIDFIQRLFELETRIRVLEKASKIPGAETTPLTKEQYLNKYWLKTLQPAEFHGKP